MTTFSQQPVSQPPVLRVVNADAPHLQHWAEELERGRWPGWILDGEMILRYVSTELKMFMSDSLGRPIDDEAAGVGTSIYRALLNGVREDPRGCQ